MKLIFAFVFSYKIKIFFFVIEIYLKRLLQQSLKFLKKIVYLSKMIKNSIAVYVNAAYFKLINQSFLIAKENLILKFVLKTSIFYV